MSPLTYNELSPGNAHLGPSFAGRAGIEIPLGSLAFMVEGDARQYAYPHVGDYDNQLYNASPSVLAAVCNDHGPAVGNRGCVTTIGGQGSTYVKSFQALDRDASINFGVEVFRDRLYLAGSYLWRGNNYGGPNMSGWGFGIEKLADYDRPFSFFGSFYYYPQVQGYWGDPTLNVTYAEQYEVKRYEIGVDFSFGHAGVNVGGFNFGPFIEAGFLGDYGGNKQFAPANFEHAGGFLGVGLHF